MPDHYSRGYLLDWMGEDCGTWVPRQHIELRSPDLNPFALSLSVGKPHTDSAFMNSDIDIGLGNGAVPFSEPSGLSSFNLSQSNLPHAWFYHSPRFRQAFMPTPNFTSIETLVAETEKDIEDVSPCVETSSLQKKNLVDQSGDKTNFFSSGLTSPIQCLTSWSPKFVCANMFGDSPFGKDSINDKGPSSKNELDMYQKADVQSEMHEDTAEINALLYSDEDCYSIEDDEVDSTGHSPSMMAKDCDKQELAGGSTEEIPSPFFRNKKRKLFEDVDNDTQLMDTASSLNCNRCVEYKSDAESRCEGGSYQRSGETSSLLGSKRMKKERVRHILNFLQNMIPGAKDKDPIMLLDDAIDCLKSLKVKARLLGLDTF